MSADLQQQPRTVGRRCVVCSHPDRARIEADLATGEYSIRGIARQHAVSPESMRRHVRGHVAPQVREAMEAVTGTPALGIAARLLDIADAARDIRREADESNDARLALAAGKAEEQTLAILADRLGIVRADALANLHDADDLTGAVLLTVQTDLNAAEAFASAFEQMGRTAWAANVRDRARRIHDSPPRLETTA
ncbi:hypothetical protein [Microbacterium sp.]|uniref:hypothetical protein n=1 Tax=Microbacterium sp. TaxID=51671 RepID=UPI0039E496D2